MSVRKMKVHSMPRHPEESALAEAKPKTSVLQKLSDAFTPRKVNSEEPHSWRHKH